MGRIWSEENSFQKWLEVEILAAEGLARLGKVSQGRRRAHQKEGALQRQAHSRN